MSQPQLSIAFSPCPNDTYIFCGLVKGFLANTGFTLAETVYEDVETLNIRAFAGTYDITKLSFHALGHVLDRYSLLSAGAALGRGCGPIVVMRNGSADFDLSGKKIAVPGRYTTAAMLLKLYCPEVQTVEMRFDRIMPFVSAGEADAGVIIHESRFTYHLHGLVAVVDLGDWWERETGGPIPLGGICLLRSYPEKIRSFVAEAIRASIKWAGGNPEICLSYIKKYAAELDDDVVRRHISLYVNSYSENLGSVGTEAIRVFLDRGKKAGLFPFGSDKIF